MTDREKLNQAIFDAYVTGLSLDAVGKKFGCSAETARQAVKSIDPKAIRKPGRKKLASKFVETIRPQDWEELEPQGDALSVPPTPAE